MTDATAAQPQHESLQAAHMSGLARTSVRPRTGTGEQTRIGPSRLRSGHGRRRAYDKCGFREQSRLRQALPWDGVWHDEILMSLLDTDRRTDAAEG